MPKPPLTASTMVSVMLPGVHRVRKRRANGGVAEYWYAWRGGPQILKAQANSDVLLAREVARATPKAIQAYEVERKPRGDQNYLYGLITRYLMTMAEDDTLAARTKADRRKHLDRARSDLGQMELRALESRRARATLIEWRDRYKATPKTADELLGAVSTVLKWAHDRGELAANPVEDFPRLYKSNRAEVIWEDHHLEILLQNSEPEFQFAVRLAALSGLREGDLIELPWSAVGTDSIVWQTNKSRRRRTIVIPMTKPLQKLLAEIPKHATTVLASSRKRPWKQAGLAAALRRARLDALEAARKAQNDPQAESGIEGLRFHDLRGTAATNYLLAGLEIADVALILGWKPERVREIAARYISAEAMGRAMVKRMGKNAPKTKAVNRPVNRTQAAPRRATNS